MFLFIAIGLLVILLLIVAVYVAYYILCVPETPQLITGNPAYLSFVQSSCPSLREFIPTFWCFTTRLQTIVGSCIKKQLNLKYKRELITTDDGGQFALDWCTCEQTETEKTPTVIILPGLTGCSSSNYVQHFADHAVKANTRVVVFNNRGNGGVALLTTQTYCAAYTNDLELVIKTLKQRLPESPLFIVAISLGSILSMNYLLRTGVNSNIVAAVLMCLPFNIPEASKSIERPLDKILFNQVLAKSLINNVMSRRTVFEGTLDLEAVQASKTIRDFDSNVVVKLFNYDHVNEYYNAATTHNRLHLLRTPVLCINALDDVFAPALQIPFKAAQKNKYLMLALTERGGHVAFLDKFWPTQDTYADRIITEYLTELTKNLEQFQTFFEN